MPNPARIAEPPTRIADASGQSTESLELDDGGVFGFEVKAGERVSGADLQGLRELRDRVGSRFAAGIALSLGSRSYTYEDRLHVMPLDRLWVLAGR